MFAGCAMPSLVKQAIAALAVCMMVGMGVVGWGIAGSGMANSIPAARAFPVASRPISFQPMPVAVGSVPVRGGDRVLQEAFDRQQSDLQVEAQGRITRLLTDDLEGSRHQRFIVQLPSGLTVLIAHNIDLAPRVAAVREGDEVRFFGEYEWTQQGGVIHWTHKDPHQQHTDGWIEHRGQRYE